MDSTRKKARVRRAETGGVRSRHKPKPALSSKHRRVQVSFPQSFHPIVVLSPPRARRRKRKPRDRHVARPQPAGCIFATVNPTSVVTVPGGRTICEYSVPGDANPADSVTFNGGPKITSISLVPIFYGSAWLTSAPSNLDVMAAMQRVLQGPYLSELGQYGFVSLDVKPPVLKADPSPPAGHSADSVGDIVWDLIDNDVFPEPDDPGGYNIYMVFYPPGTAISDLNACGWHSRYWDYDFPFDLDWAWVGAVDFPTGGANTTVTLNNIIRVFSHELVEMITDPEASGGWAMDRSINGGDEIGDACNNTVDFVNGTLVNAYWSERHKACIIPKPTDFIVIDLKESTLASQSVASGVAQINLLFCLRNQSYHWDILFQDEQVVFSANAVHFQNPVFSWTLLDALGGPRTLANGFNGAVTLVAQTWYEDVSGASHSTSAFTISVSVAGNQLTIRNSNPANLFSFLVNLQVSASEGAFTASTTIQRRVTSETLKYEDAYYTALKACRDRLNKLIHQEIPHLPPINPGDPPWAWEERLSPWVSGERLWIAAMAATLAAAVQNAKPELASELRHDAAATLSVPLASLTPSFVSRGRTGFRAPPQLT